MNDNTDKVIDQVNLQEMIAVMNECYERPTVLINKVITSKVGNFFRLNLCEEIIGLTPSIRCRGAYLVDESVLRSLLQMLTDTIEKIEKDRDNG
jgi:hypothetical protein